MTNQAQGITPPTPSPWYWTARGMKEDRSNTTKRLVKGIDRAADNIGKKLGTMQEALGLIRNPDPAERLMAYYAKPDTWEQAMMMFEEGLIKVPYSWESQQAYFPNDYEEAWDDFQKLRLRARSGDVGPVVQAQELAYSTEPLDEEFVSDSVL